MQRPPASITNLFPCCNDADVLEFLINLPSLRLQPWSVSVDRARWEWIPVPLLRWTHSGIDSQMIFAHDAREGRSVYETTNQLWRGEITTRDITPLEAVYYDGKLWSLSNRRLAALKMYQALSHDVIWVRCVLRNEQCQKFDRASTTLNDGLGISPNSELC